ncbi:isochorismatase family cysteine hydrolase [Pedobacter panaciterrae]|uniref:Isochorismatase family cysteine hydrolase n=1 Tax=Pedobacter panaciterrae TaxID=363849 RepID=A0ABU8NJT1_9SPHI
MKIKNFLVVLTCLLFTGVGQLWSQEMKRNHSALLVMDMQEPILGDIDKNVVASIAKAIRFARSQGIAVIYVKAVLRKGAPEISDNNKFFSARRAFLEKVDPEKWVKTPEEIAPEPGDLIIEKRRFSSFEGTDLDMILRSKGYSELIMCGVMTSGVVLSTVRDAADKDYSIVVISDGCGDPDKETNEFLMKKIFPLQSTVVSVAQWTKM